VFGHPLRSCKMSCIDPASALGIALRIEEKYDFGNLHPIGTLRLRIEKTQIKLEMLTVVGREFGVGRRTVREFNFGHAVLPFRFCPRCWRS
jgi:hypothetical protein